MIYRNMGKGEFRELLHANFEHKILDVHLEVTERCNYDCPYCYIHSDLGKVISKEKFTLCVDKMQQEGVLYLTLSGGEPLSHPEFLWFYRYAKQKIPFVSVFTNGSLISEKWIDEWKKNPPYALEITLYGTTADAYDAIVQRKGAFDHFSRVLEQLDENHIAYTLKTTITTESERLSDYLEFSKQHHVPFRYDTLVIPCIDRTSVNSQSFQVSSLEAVKLVCENEHYIEKLRSNIPMDRTNEKYTCDAGETSLFIDASLRAGLCVAVRTPGYQITEETSLKQAAQALAMYKEGTLTPADQCYDCEERPFCRYCPGRFEAEGLSTKNPPEWACSYAQKLKKYVQGVKVSYGG
ncbi:MAG: radical SAM protein [Lachnospiraceae bacterium]|nr:radical SAM protein [Lachnospiraceae bacterium]